MSPLTTVRNKRKNMISTKATGSIENKKSRISSDTPKLRNAASASKIAVQMPTLRSPKSPKHTSTQDPSCPDEPSVLTPNHLNTPSQADIFSQCDSPHLTFLSPTQPLDFEEELAED